MLVVADEAVFNLMAGRGASLIYCWREKTGMYPARCESSNECRAVNHLMNKTEVRIINICMQLLLVFIKHSGTFETQLLPRTVGSSMLHIPFVIERKKQSMPNQYYSEMQETTD